MLRAARRDRELPSVWLGVKSAFPHRCRRRRCLRESGEDRRGVKEESLPPPPPPPRAPAAGRGRSRSPGSRRSGETKRCDAPSAPLARHSCPPAACPLRAAPITLGRPTGTAGTLRLRSQPLRAPRGPVSGPVPAAPGVAWVGCPARRRAAPPPPPPNCYQYAAGHQLHQNKTSRKVFKKSKQRRK